MGELGSKPTTDWYFSLLCFGVAFIIVICLNAFFYVRLVVNETPVESVGDVGAAHLDREAISKAVDALNRKESDAQFVSDVLVNDPSL